MKTMKKTSRAKVLDDMLLIVMMLSFAPFGISLKIQMWGLHSNEMTRMVLAISFLVLAFSTNIYILRNWQELKAKFDKFL